MIRYYFIDKERYFAGKKFPPTKVELFCVEETNKGYTGYDKDGADYLIDKEDIIIESDEVE